MAQLEKFPVDGLLFGIGNPGTRSVFQYAPGTDAVIGLIGLVIVRLGLGIVTPPGTPLAQRRMWHSVACALYLAGATLGGLAMSLTLEERMLDLVLEPGGIFRVAFTRAW